MRHIIEALEGLDASLRRTDPGDFPAFESLLRQRAVWVKALAAEVEAGAAGADAAELLERLRAIEAGAAEPYRGVMLHRLLLQQQLAGLRQQRAVLRAFTPEPDGNPVGVLLTTDI